MAENNIDTRQQQPEVVDKAKSETPQARADRLVNQVVDSIAKDRDSYYKQQAIGYRDFSPAERKKIESDIKTQGLVFSLEKHDKTRKDAENSRQKPNESNRDYLKRLNYDISHDVKIAISNDASSTEVDCNRLADQIKTLGKVDGLDSFLFKKACIDRDKAHSAFSKGLNNIESGTLFTLTAFVAVPSVAILEGVNEVFPKVEIPVDKMEKGIGKILHGLPIY